MFHTAFFVAKEAKVSYNILSLLNHRRNSMGACNWYSMPPIQTHLCIGAGEKRVDGIYRLCSKRAWRNGFPAYKNSSGYYLSYESVGTSESARGWIIGKMPTAFYGVKSELSCPPQAGWETFAGLEPSPQIVFTKFDADKLRANIFRDRVIKNKKQVFTW